MSGTLQQVNSHSLSIWFFLEHIPASSVHHSTSRETDRWSYKDPKRLERSAIYLSSGFGFFDVLIFELYNGYNGEEFDGGNASSFPITHACTARSLNYRRKLISEQKYQPSTIWRRIWSSAHWQSVEKGPVDSVTSNNQNPFEVVNLKTLEVITKQFLVTSIIVSIVDDDYIGLSL